MSPKEMYQKAYSQIRWGWQFDECEDTPKYLQGMPLNIIAAAYLTHDLSRKQERWHKNRIARMALDKKVSWDMAILPPERHDKILERYAKRLRELPTK